MTSYSMKITVAIAIGATGARALTLLSGHEQRAEPVTVCAEPITQIEVCAEPITQCHLSNSGTVQAEPIKPAASHLEGEFLEVQEVSEPFTCSAPENGTGQFTVMRGPKFIAKGTMLTWVKAVKSLDKKAKAVLLMRKICIGDSSGCEDIPLTEVETRYLQNISRQHAAYYTPSPYSKPQWSKVQSLVKLIGKTFKGFYDQNLDYVPFDGTTIPDNAVYVRACGGLAAEIPEGFLGAFNQVQVPLQKFEVQSKTLQKLQREASWWRRTGKWLGRKVARLRNLCTRRNQVSPTSTSSADPEDAKPIRQKFAETLAKTFNQFLEFEDDITVCFDDAQAVFGILKEPDQQTKIGKTIAMLPRPLKDQLLNLESMVDGESGHQIPFVNASTLISALQYEVEVANRQSVVRAEGRQQVGVSLLYGGPLFVVYAAFWFLVILICIACPPAGVIALVVMMVLSLSYLAVYFYGGFVHGASGIVKMWTGERAEAEAWEKKWLELFNPSRRAALAASHQQERKANNGRLVEPDDRDHPARIGDDMYQAGGPLGTFAAVVKEREGLEGAVRRRRR